MQRRRFIRQLSSSIGAAALAGSAPAIIVRNTLAQTRRNSLGFAFVGLGNYATRLASNLADAKHCHIAGVVTGTPAKEKTWAEQYNIPDTNIYNYENYDSIANNDDIDIVYVVLPNSMHMEYVIRAAEAGKHVICEKPMALNTDQCARMIAACENNNVKLSIGYRCQFHPVHQEIIRIGQHKEMGATKVIQAGFGFRIGNPNQWRLKKELAGGGALYDVGVYCIQAARYATGEEPISVSAQEIKTDPVKFNEVDETVLWQMKFASGAIASCSTSYSSSFNSFYAAMEGGWTRIDSAYGYGGQTGATSQGAIEAPESNMWAAQMDDFSLCVQEDRKSRVSGEEGLHDVRVLDAIYESIATEKPVDLI